MSFIFDSPSTPSSSSSPLASEPYTPIKSSLLAAPLSSPIEAVRARRRGQFKSGPARQPTKTFFNSDDTSQSFLREKLKAKYVQKAREERSNALRSKNRLYNSSSDTFECEGEAMEEEENDDDELNDELFRRIIANDSRKREHAYKASYEREVGWSSDPAYEDPSLLEHEFMIDETEPPPYDPNEELEEYFMDYAAQQESPSEFESNIQFSKPQYCEVPRSDPLTTPERLQQMVYLFPTSSSPAT